MIAKSAEQIERGDFADLQYIEDFAEALEEEGSKNGRQFRNSRPLDVHRWGDFPELTELTNKLSAELFRDVHGNAKEKRHKHLRLLLTDLLHSYRQDPDQYIGYSRGKANYGLPVRYSKLFIKYRPLIHTVDALREAGYVDHQKGFYDRRRSGRGFQSRMKASKKLIEHFDAARAFAIAPLSRSSDEELIVLRDSNKKEIDYQDNDNTKAMREALLAYNALLGRTYIDVELKGYEQPIKIDLTNKLVKRVFNNSRWDRGGRFYGGWWQNAPRAIRARIVVRDRRTQEIDYRGLHAVLAYAMEGIDYFRDIGADPYTLKNFDSKGEPERYRDLVKLSFQVSLNSSGLDQAVKGVQKAINFNQQDYPDQFDIREVLSRVQDLHKPISRHFYSGLGLKLQWIDSQIAESVIVEMTKAEVAVLCVHDSFICESGEVKRLEGLLETKIAEVLDRNGIRPIQADLKQISFYSPGAKGLITHDLNELAEGLDMAQMKRKEAWGQYRIQQPVNYILSNGNSK